MYMLDVAQLVDDATNHARQNFWINTEGVKSPRPNEGDTDGLSTLVV